MSELDALLADGSLWRAGDQRVGWSYEAWISTLTRPGGLPTTVVDTLEALEDRWAADGGLLRQAVVDVAAGDPVRLLVASMVWGFGTLPYGPMRTSAMMETPDLTAKLRDLVSAAQESPEAGFSALFSGGRPIVKGLGIAMGTKLLYFAARSSRVAVSALPLVLDQNVYAALVAIDDAAVSRPIPNPGQRVRGVEYGRLVRELALVAGRAGLHPDDVECALFQYSTWRRRQLRFGRRPATAWS